MTLYRMIPLPESRPVLSAPPARFKSGRRAPGGVGRSPNRAFSLRSRGLRGRSKVCNFRLPEVRNFRLPLTPGHEVFNNKTFSEEMLPE